MYIKSIFILLFAPLLISGQQSAFISGNDTICDNGTSAEVNISFTGVAPYTFVYSLNGVSQSPIITNLDLYVLNTKQAGIYRLESFSDALDVGGISGEAYVTVLSSPIADFHWTDEITILDPMATFVDNSIGHIDRWEWSFEDGSVYNGSYIDHLFTSFRDQKVQLIVFDDLTSCSDTTFKNILTGEWNEHWIYIPNSFSPDNEYPNDVFCISHNGILEETFMFTIYNKISDIVFSTTDISELECLFSGRILLDNGWDGTHQDTGEDLPMGMYVYEISYQDIEYWKYQDFGTLFLIR